MLNTTEDTIDVLVRHYSHKNFSRSELLQKVWEVTSGLEPDERLKKQKEIRMLTRKKK